MSSTERIVFYLMLFVLWLSVFSGSSHEVVRKLPRQVSPPKRLFSSNSKEKKTGEATEVPTFFSRRNKDGKIINAFEKDAWFDIHSRQSGESSLDTKANLTIDPSLIKNNENISVVWEGVTNPTAKDIIALYCPEYSKDNEYIDYFNADVSSTYEQGHGEHWVQLVNFRADCEMRYFRNYSQDHQELVATSNIVKFEGGPEQPLQVHLALTGDPSEMRVMWVSGTNVTPVVKFSVDKSLSLVAEGKSQTYNGADLCFLNGMFIDPGYIHDVKLTGLKPYTTYYYSCGVEGHMSEIRSFKTAPPVGSDVSYKFIVYGDMGMSPAAHATAKYAFRDIMNGYEFIFHHGDISYARGYAYIWDQWHALIEPYASIAPYMVGIGNHEQDHLDVSDKDPSNVTGNGWHPWWGNYGDDSNGECGVPMFHRFHMPENGNHLWWYSYDYGMVHYIMMSTEHNMGVGSRQYSWLEKDLMSVNRSKTPWIILAGHRPMYTSELAISDLFVSYGMQHLFEDLLYKYRVDLALWAHYHSYERTCPVYRKKCQQDGITHITIGTAGKEEDTESYEKEDWSLFQRKDDPYGYGRVTIANRSALHWEYFVNSQDKVIDDVWLKKPKHVRSSTHERDTLF